MRRRILVVEDDLTLRQVLTFNLQKEGYEVAGASDGESGLAAALSGRLRRALFDLENRRGGDWALRFLLEL